MKVNTIKVNSAEVIDKVSINVYNGAYFYGIRLISEHGEYIVDKKWSSSGGGRWID